MSDNSWDKDWLTFSRKARRGIFVLLFVFIVVAVLPRVYRNNFMDNPLNVQIASLSMEMNDKEAIKLKIASKKQPTSKERREQKAFKYNIPTEPFDPNTYSFEDWKAIGFSKKQVQTILNYRQNGGEFKVKKDVKKLYIIDDDLYSDLYEVIDLPDTISSIDKPDFTKEKKTTERIVLNINTCTLEELKQVSGIGPFFAEEIVKLRAGYGGIHDLNQLLEIYRMDEEKLSTIEESFTIERADIKRLNINTATRKELNQHKEISWNIASSIVSIRESHGDYKKIDDLLKSVLIDRGKLEKLRPYLSVE